MTRPAALSCWAPLEKLIGASGAMAAPKWCLVLGASGAAAFFAGIAKASLVASVNIDPAAPIANRSDLAATGDAKAVLGELAGLLGISPAPKTSAEPEERTGGKAKASPEG